MLDNVTVALLSKVNELLERYGVHPCDVVVTARTDEQYNTVIFFENPPPAPQAEERFYRLLTNLGLSEHQLKLTGDDREIYHKLQDALDRAPRARPRR